MYFKISYLKNGGAPTTLILRHSDNELDKYTKQRYREKLVSLVSNFKMSVKEQKELIPLMQINTIFQQLTI